MGASRLAQQLLQQADTDAMMLKLHQFGKLPELVLQGIQQMADLRHDVASCVSKAITLLQDQLAENYKKDWTKRQHDFELVKQLASKHSQLSEFLEEYVLDPISITEMQRLEQSDVVTLITIHSAKGTEQKVCYVANVSAGQYPHARVQGSFDDVEEERRVLYVALTRAKNELILTKQNLNFWAKTQIDERGRSIESYFLNDLSRPLCQMETHYRTRQQTVKSALIERKSINLDFGIDLD